jgi:hypothetical protein
VADWRRPARRAPIMRHHMLLNLVSTRSGGDVRRTLTLRTRRTELRRGGGGDTGSIAARTSSASRSFLNRSAGRASGWVCQSAASSTRRAGRSPSSRHENKVGQERWNHVPRAAPGVSEPADTRQPPAKRDVRR